MRMRVTWRSIRQCWVRMGPLRSLEAKSRIVCPPWAWKGGLGGLAQGGHVFVVWELWTLWPEEGQKGSEKPNGLWKTRKMASLRQNVQTSEICGNRGKLVSKSPNNLRSTKEARRGSHLRSQVIWGLWMGAEVTLVSWVGSLLGSQRLKWGFEVSLRILKESK